MDWPTLTPEQSEWHRAHWFLPSELTDAQCEQVRQWRCVDGFTWRAVADAAHKAFGGKWEPSWNQLAGIDLCAAAAQRLGENPEDEKWNG